MIIIIIICINLVSSPMLLLVAPTSATSVIVEWSQPSGGATVTGYVVHYSDGVTNMTESVPASSTSLLVTNLTSCRNYTFSVEATSERFSGHSKRFLLTLGKLTLSVATVFASYIMQILFFLLRCLTTSECHSRSCQFKSHLSPVR